MPHALNWFEIPVTDLPRSKEFYETVLDISIELLSMGPMTLGMLSSDPSVVGGALVHAEGMTPSQEGTIVYLNGGEDLAPMLSRVSRAGGTVVLPKTEIGSDSGFFAHFVDTEGNRVGLHSLK